MFGVKGALSCFNQLALDTNFILELFMYTSFGQILLFNVKGDVNFSFEYPLDFYYGIVSGRPEDVEIVL